MTLQGMIIQSALDHNFQLLEQQLELKCPTLEKNFGRCCYPKTIDGYGKKNPSNMGTHVWIDSPPLCLSDRHKPHIINHEIATIFKRGNHVIVQQGVQLFSVQHVRPKF